MNYGGLPAGVSAAHSRRQLYGIFTGLSTSFICAIIALFLESADKNLCCIRLLSEIDPAAKVRPLNIGGILLELGQLLHEIGVRDTHERPLHAE